MIVCLEFLFILGTLRTPLRPKPKLVKKRIGVRVAFHVLTFLTQALFSRQEFLVVLVKRDADVRRCVFCHRAIRHRANRHPRVGHVSENFLTSFTRSVCDIPCHHSPMCAPCVVTSSVRRRSYASQTRIALCVTRPAHGHFPVLQRSEPFAAGTVPGSSYPVEQLKQIPYMASSKSTSGGRGRRQGRRLAGSFFSG